MKEISSLKTNQHQGYENDDLPLSMYLLGDNGGRLVGACIFDWYCNADHQRDDFNPKLRLD
jgi:hypothetical protein